MSKTVLQPTELRTLLKSFKEQYAKEYQLRALGYFGSYTRNEAGEESDVDIVFDTDAPNLFKTAMLKQDLEICPFATFHGKKAGRLVSVGPVNLPVTRLFVEEVILECRKKHITKVDILGFEFEMGLFPNVLDEARAKGIDIAPKYIPAEVFDKRAVEKNQVVFHDVSFIEVKPLISYPPDKGGKGGYIAYNPNLKEKARDNRKNPTPAENKLWYEVLRNKQFSHLKFTRQKPLDEYIVDLYCAELMLAIEIDGDSHAEQEEYDEVRTARLSNTSAGMYLGAMSIPLARASSSTFGKSPISNSKPSMSTRVM